MVYTLQVEKQATKPPNAPGRKLSSVSIATSPAIKVSNARPKVMKKNAINVMCDTDAVETFN
jgi:hypothetical protein